MISFVPGQEQRADIGTKALSADRLKELMLLWGFVWPELACKAVDFTNQQACLMRLIVLATIALQLEQAQGAKFLDEDSQCPKGGEVDFYKPPLEVENPLSIYVVVGCGVLGVLIAWEVGKCLVKWTVRKVGRCAKARRLRREVQNQLRLQLQSSVNSGPLPPGNTTYRPEPLNLPKVSPNPLDPNCEFVGHQAPHPITVQVSIPAPPAPPLPPAPAHVCAVGTREQPSSSTSPPPPPPRSRSAGTRSRVEEVVSEELQRQVARWLPQKQDGSVQTDREQVFCLNGQETMYSTRKGGSYHFFRDCAAIRNSNVDSRRFCAFCFNRRFGTG